MSHRTVNQQDTDRPAPPAEGGYEVVTADGDRKPASLQQRVRDKVRDLTSMTDEQPSWPAELADPSASNGDVVPGRHGQDITPEQPPQTVIDAYRQQHEINIQRVADETARRTAQLVTMDQQARARVHDIGRLFALDALRNEAAAQLHGDGWGLVQSHLIGEFEREIAGWKQDRGIAP